jgi:hypothetical protein
VISKFIAIVALIIMAAGGAGAATGLRFNELMISPATGSEWVELSNIDASPQIMNATIVDRSGRVVLVTAGGMLSTHGFWILSRDSATIESLNLPPYVRWTILSNWPSMNDNGDSLTLFDGAGILSDRVVYRQEDAPTRGHSLERIDLNEDGLNPGNWGECADPVGNTAGQENSLHPVNAETKPRLWAEPNPFSPDGDSHDDIARFHFSLPAASSRITLDLFTVDGRPLLRLAHDLPAGNSVPTIIWDGKVNGETCAVGRYVAVISALSATSGSTYTARCTVVLARRL